LEQIVQAVVERLRVEGDRAREAKVERQLLPPEEWA
jgi:hypothetical protein